MAQQGEIEGAHPRRVSGQGRGRRGRHPPARIGGARHGIGVHAHKQRGDARLFRRQRQAAAGGQIQLRRAPPDFEHQRAKSRASQGVHGGAQQHGFIAHHADQQMRRIDSQGRQPRSIGHPLTRGGGGTKPQGRGFRSREARKDQRKARDRRLPAFASEEFVNPPARQPAVQRPVDRRMAKREMRVARDSRAIQRSDAPPEGGKGAGRLDHTVLYLFFSILRAFLSIARCLWRSKAWGINIAHGKEDEADRFMRRCGASQPRSLAASQPRSLAASAQSGE